MPTENETARNEILLDTDDISLEDLDEQDQSVLVQALRRYRSEASVAYERVTRHGSFDSHNSSPW
jgi:hypothetical protein